MSEEKKLKELEEKMLADKSLSLMESRLVFGEGNPRANVVFVGEAPGFYEDREGRPFVGRAGKLLDKLIENAGSKREDFYITNIVKRRPPNNRDPLPQEISAYRPYMEEQITIIAPKVIVPLGRYAMNHFLPKAKISQDQGKVFWWQNILLMPLYHPAAALRRANLVKDIEDGLAKLPKLVSEYKNLLQKKEAKAAEGRSSEEESKEQPQLFT